MCRHDDLVRTALHRGTNDRSGRRAAPHRDGDIMIVGLEVTLALSR
jgi:hypothetical protein